MYAVECGGPAGPGKCDTSAAELRDPTVFDDHNSVCKPRYDGDSCGVSPTTTVTVIVSPGQRREEAPKTGAAGRRGKSSYPPLPSALLLSGPVVIENEWRYLDDSDNNVGFLSHDNGTDAGERIVRFATDNGPQYIRLETVTLSAYETTTGVL